MTEPTAPWLLALLLSAAQPGGGTIVDVEVRHHGGVFQVTSVTDYTAPAAAVFAVLADYQRFTRLSSAITASGVLAEPAADGATRVHTTVRGCVLFFCRDIRRVERLYLEPHEQIVTRVEPQSSDLAEGESRWRFSVLPGGGTRVEFEMTMVPEFWIPPVIGPALIKRRLARDGVRAVGRIDALAWEHVEQTRAREADGPAGAQPDATP